MRGVFKILVPILAVWLVWGCERDYMFRGGNDGVRFSVDTVMFDTIFTSFGSTTKHFRVYNHYGSDMLIDGIRLAGGENSKFRININGISEHTVNDVPLRSGDSLFVFVEVTIDPSEVDAPFVVTDSVIFYTRERIQSVQLVAYGQNVVVLRKRNLKTQRFTADRPYLIYDWVVVDSLETLTVDPGARLHFYKNASLFVFGTLNVKGTRDEPVLFAGSRLEEWYADKPGQWGYIYLMPGSTNHVIDYAIIRNGTMGLVVDSVGVDGDPPLYISNTRIEHKARQGLVAQASSIVASNSLFADCGSAAVALTVGGHYEFYHSTIANYYRWAFRGVPALVLSNYYLDKDGAIRTNNLEEALFSNCIIYGLSDNEIGLDFKSNSDDFENEVVSYRFDHSLIRTTLKNERLSDPKHFRDVIINRDPSFISPVNSNYQLDTLSVAKDAGDINAARRFPKDFNGNSRLNDKGPDLGFIERIERQ